MRALLLRAPLAALLLAALVVAPAAPAQTASARLQDLVVPAGAAPVQLIGDGIASG